MRVILFIAAIAICATSRAYAGNVSDDLSKGAGSILKGSSQTSGSAISGNTGFQPAQDAADTISPQSDNMPESTHVDATTKRNTIGKKSLSGATVNVKKIYDGSRSYYEDTQTDNSPKQIKDASKIKPSAGNNNKDD